MLVSLIITSSVILFFILLLYHVDSEKEPVKYLTTALLVGFIAGVAERLVVRYFILKLMPIHDLEFFTATLNDEYTRVNIARGIVSSILIGGFSMEIVKMFAYEWITHRYDKEIDQPYDCMIYAVMAGLGFQLFQTLMLLQNTPDAWQDGFYKSMGVVQSVLCGFALGWVYSYYYKFPVSKYSSTFPRFGAIFTGFLFALSVHVITRILFIWKETITTYIGIAAMLFFLIYLGNKVSQLYKQPDKYQDQK